VAEIMRFCKEKMPVFMIPRYVELVDDVPKLANEKADKERMKKEPLTPTTWDVETGKYVK
jgi:crotonobetaine/carnitine-CoA ligase